MANKELPKYCASGPVVLISCSSRKIKPKPGQTIEAKDLYCSSLFNKAWEYAKQLKPSRIFILSAKYGLLEPTDKIAHYDKSLVKAGVAERKQWACAVIASIKQKGINIDETDFVILAGKVYYQYIIPHLSHKTLPYEGCKGIGEILRFLNSKIK